MAAGSRAQNSPFRATVNLTKLYFTQDQHGTTGPLA